MATTVATTTAFRDPSTSSLYARGEDVLPARGPRRAHACCSPGPADSATEASQYGASKSDVKSGTEYSSAGGRAEGQRRRGGTAPHPTLPGVRRRPATPPPPRDVTPAPLLVCPVCFARSLQSYGLSLRPLSSHSSRGSSGPGAQFASRKLESRGPRGACVQPRAGSGRAGCAWLRRRGQSTAVCGSSQRGAGEHSNDSLRGMGRARNLPCPQGMS